jgi:hypothetical protein
MAVDTAAACSQEHDGADTLNAAWLQLLTAANHDGIRPLCALSCWGTATMFLLDTHVGFSGWMLQRCGADPACLLVLSSAAVQLPLLGHTRQKRAGYCRRQKKLSQQAVVYSFV